jgi:hypothetical protein
VKGEATDLASHGYAVLTWSARGFGRSGGQIALDSPDYQVKDVRQLIDSLFPDVSGEGPRNGVFKKLWAGIFFTNGSPTGPASTACGPTACTRGAAHGSGLGVHCYVVERTIGLLHWFRRLRIRWEIRDDIHEAFTTLAAAIICW